MFGRLGVEAEMDGESGELELRRDGLAEAGAMMQMQAEQAAVR